MPPPPRRGLARPALALIAATLLLGACAAGPPEPTAEPAAEPLTVGLTYVPDIQFAPFYVAAERGFYDEAGVEVTLRHHGPDEGLFTALDSGEEDAVVAGGDELLQARSQGMDLLSVATLYQRYPVALIVPADSPIQEPADLAGHRVGIPGPFGESYFGLLALLRGAGLTEADVAVTHIGYTAQAALPGGHVDAVIGYVNNDAVQFERAGTPVRTIPLVDGELPLIGVGLGTTDRAAEDRPEAVAAFVAATLRGVQEVIADPDAAIEDAAAYIPDLTRPDSREAARATLDATIPLYTAGSALGAQDGQVWSEMAGFLDAHDLLGEPVQAETAWTDRFLPDQTG